MIRLGSLLLLFLTTQLAIAQSPQTYINSRGEKHLTGPFDLEVLRTDSVYKQWFENSTTLFALKGDKTKWKKQLKDTQVDIYLGTWCGDSKRWVPQFVKLWNDLGLNENQLNFIALYDGVEQYKQGPNQEEKGLRIHRVPTFIFKEDNKEYARVVEYPRNDLELDVAQIAMRYASEPNYRAATYLLNLFEKESMETVMKDIRIHLNKVNQLVSKDRELNTLGFVFQRSDRMQEALLTFQFNTLIHPHSPRAFNSYAEALLANDNKPQAISAFKRVIALEPEHKNANEQLKVLALEEK